MTHEQSNRESQEAERIRGILEKRSNEMVSKAMKDIQDGPASGWYGKAQDAVKNDRQQWYANLDKIREGVADWQQNSAAARIYDGTRAAFADTIRRFEERWFGSPTQDILFERQQPTIHGLNRHQATMHSDRGKPEDQEAAKGEPAQQTMVHGKEEEQTTVHGKDEKKENNVKESIEKAMDNYWKDFYHQHGLDQDHGHGQDMSR
jgi:hypothetical protein